MEKAQEALRSGGKRGLVVFFLFDLNPSLVYLSFFFCWFVCFFCGDVFFGVE